MLGVFIAQISTWYTLFSGQLERERLNSQISMQIREQREGLTLYGLKRMHIQGEGGEIDCDHGFIRRLLNAKAPGS